MVRARVRGNMRMREQNTKTTVPPDVVPERRTKRFPTRFRPVGRFCELRFRYLSSPIGREGEISRPLDHMRQIPFIHSVTISIYIEQSSRYFLHVVRLGVYSCRAFSTIFWIRSKYNFFYFRNFMLSNPII